MVATLAGSFNGLAFGPGSKVHVTGIDGVDDLPELRTQDAPRSNADGDYTGPDRSGPRTVTMSFGLRGDDPDDLAALVQAVRAATVPMDQPLPLLLRDSTLLLWAKPRRRSIPYDATARRRVGSAVVEFYCPDPNVYDAVEQAPTTSLPAGSGGLALPMTFPLAFGSVGVGGLLTATNTGTVAVRPQLEVLAGGLAQLVNPRIENTRTGQVLQFAITLAVGSWLTIDTDERTVLLNDSASRRANLLGVLDFQLDPGDNDVTFRADSGGTDATLTVRYHSPGL